MSDICILGDGVAALTLSYYLKKHSSVTVISSKDHWEVSTVGARFIHPKLSSNLDDMMKLINTKPIIEEIRGGVEKYDRVVSFFSWEELVADPDLRLQLTYEYAISTGRDWSIDILNNLLTMTEVPRYYTNPTYASLISFMSNNNDANLLLDKIEWISLENKEIVLTSGVIQYKYLINTLPLWVFRDLVLPHNLPHCDIRYTDERYASVIKNNRVVPTSMTYYVGHDVEELFGYPLKRASYIDGNITYEYYKKPENYTLELLTLPPNLSSPKLSQINSLNQYLNDKDVFLLGRYAQIAPKLMLTDIIDTAQQLSLQIGG